MTSFFDYLVASTKEFHYRIRTILPIDDVTLDRVEYVLSKYDLVSIDGPKKTIMQSRPLDFSNMLAAEIYIIDIVTHIPVSPYILQQELRHILGVTESQIVVRGENDPNELQSNKREDEAVADAEAAKDDLRRAPMLSTDPRYPEYEKVISDELVTGDEYTKRFLKYLAKVAAERVIVVAPTKSDKKMFDYLKDMPLDPEYFKDSPLVKPVVVKPGEKVLPLSKTSNYGNFDDTIKGVSRAYINKNGDEVVVTSRKV